MTDDFQPAAKAHPAFRVRDPDALGERLRSAGVGIEADDALPDVHRFYAFDPFGNRVEFVADADGGFTERR